MGDSAVNFECLPAQDVSRQVAMTQASVPIPSVRPEEWNDAKRNSSIYPSADEQNKGSVYGGSAVKASAEGTATGDDPQSLNQELQQQPGGEFKQPPRKKWNKRRNPQTRARLKKQQKQLRAQQGNLTGLWPMGQAAATGGTALKDVHVHELQERGVERREQQKVQIAETRRGTKLNRLLAMAEEEWKLELRKEVEKELKVEFEEKVRKIQAQLDETKKQVQAEMKKQQQEFQNLLRIKDSNLKDLRRVYSDVCTMHAQHKQQENLKLKQARALYTEAKQQLERSEKKIREMQFEIGVLQNQREPQLWWEQQQPRMWQQQSQAALGEMSTITPLQQPLHGWRLHQQHQWQSDMRMQEQILNSDESQQ